MSAYLLESDKVSIAFDERGHMTSLVNKHTASELLPYRGLEDNWKIMALGTGHLVDYILGKDQIPDAVDRQESVGATALVFSYRNLQKEDRSFHIPLRFIVSLARDSDEIHFRIEVENHHDTRIREVWFPILGGFTGFTVNGEPNVVNLVKDRTFAKDVLHQGLPHPEYVFCVEEETCHWTYPGAQMQWGDLGVDREGLYIGSHDKTLTLTEFRVEKYPAEVGLANPSKAGIIFPKDTPRWLRIAVGKVVAIDPGESWASEPVVIAPHVGDWHIAADKYRTWALSWQQRPTRPPKLKDFVGWHHLLGKTYLGEVYYSFEHATQVMAHVQARCGIDVLNYYGHTQLGSEGDDSDYSPATDLGGKDGFRRMCDELHRRGQKVIVFTHRQSSLNMEDPAFEHYREWAVRDRLGQVRTEIWWKTTIESLRTYGAGVHYEGGGPVVARICPYCDEWWDSGIAEFKKLIDLGLDGFQLDTIEASAPICYAENHGHKPGINTHAKMMEQLARMRRELTTHKPDFILCGEEFGDYLFQVLDLPFSRYWMEEGYQVFHYTFPETMETVSVPAYGYDQVNKALMLGLGLDIEIWVLKKSLLDCPDFMDYIGGVNRIRRAFPDTLINGRFIDTLKARVEGRVHYGVHEGPRGLAIVLWNRSNEPKACQATFAEAGLTHGRLCIPNANWEEVELPCRLTLAPHGVAVIVAEEP